MLSTVIQMRKANFLAAQTLSQIMQALIYFSDSPQTLTLSYKQATCLVALQSSIHHHDYAPMLTCQVEIVGDYSLLATHHLTACHPSLPPLTSSLSPPTCHLQLLIPGSQQSAQPIELSQVLHPSISPLEQTWLLHTLGDAVSDPGSASTAPAYTSAVLRALLHSVSSGTFTSALTAPVKQAASSSNFNSFSELSHSDPLHRCNTQSLVKALLTAASHVAAVAALADEVAAADSHSMVGSSGNSSGSSSSAQPPLDDTRSASQTSTQLTAGSTLLSTAQQLVLAVTRVETQAHTSSSNARDTDRASSISSDGETVHDQAGLSSPVASTSARGGPNHRSRMEMWSDLSELACAYRCSFEEDAVRLAAQAVIRSLCRFGPKELMDAAEQGVDSRPTETQKRGTSYEYSKKKAMKASSLDRTASAAAGWLLPHLYSGTSDPQLLQLRQQLLQLVLLSPVPSEPAAASSDVSPAGGFAAQPESVLISDDTFLSLSGPFLMSLSRSGCSSAEALQDMAVVLVQGVQARVAAQVASVQASSEQWSSSEGVVGSGPASSRVLAMGMRCAAQLGSALDQVRMIMFPLAGPSTQVGSSFCAMSYCCMTTVWRQVLI